MAGSQIKRGHISFLAKKKGWDTGTFCWLVNHFSQEKGLEDII